MASRNIFSPAGALPNIQRPIRIVNPTGMQPADTSGQGQAQNPPSGSNPRPAVVQDSASTCVAKLQEFTAANASAHADWFAMASDGRSLVPTQTGLDAFIQAYPSCSAWVQAGMPAPPPAPPVVTPPVIVPSTVATTTPTAVSTTPPATSSNAVVAYWQSMPLAARYTVIALTGALVGIGVVKIVDRMGKKEPSEKAKASEKK